MTTPTSTTPTSTTPTLQATSPGAPDSRRPVSVDFTDRRRRRRRRLSILAIVLALVAIGVGVWVVLFSSALAVETVRVAGAEGTSADEVLAAAAIPTGVPLARVDTGTAQAAVAGLPWVAAVEVRRGWPREVVIAVEPRTAIARVGEGSVVDAAGVVFDPVGEVPRGLPRVDADGVGLQTAMAVLDSLPADLLRKVVSVSATTRDDAELTLRSGALVRWGSAEQPAFKADVLRALMRKPKDMYDVSAPELPTTFNR